MEDLTIRRRNRLKNHYTMTSNVLLLGYRHLSDGAKLTYQVIDSYDWSDGAGLRKGYAFPSIANLARARGVSERTLQRQIQELTNAGLLAKEERPGQTNFLYIEDVSKQEAQVYLQRFGRGDTDDRGGVTKLTPPTSLEEEGREEDKIVNEVESTRQEGGSQHISELIRNKVERLKRIGPAPPDKAKRDYLAGEMLRLLRDDHSLGFYRRVAERYPPHIIFETLGQVRGAVREGRVRKSRGALFVHSLRKRQPEDTIRPWSAQN